MTRPTRRIYCSGPLFCPEERAGMARLAGVLEGAGYDTFLPHRDGLETPVMAVTKLLGAQANALGPVSRLVQRSIFALDVFQIVERCDGLVFNMNGRVPDEGAVAETAIAFASGTPLVLYKEDARSFMDGIDNPMLTGLSASFSSVGALRDLPAAVGEALRRAEADGPTPYRDDAIPRGMARTVTFGRRVWALLEQWNSRRRTDAPPDELLSELGRLDSDQG